MRDREGFADLVGSTVTIEEAELELRVAAVEPAGEQHFSVRFTGPPSPVLAQATYTFRSGEESAPIFIVPIASDESGTTYEAVFSTPASGPP